MPEAGVVRDPDDRLDPRFGHLLHRDTDHAAVPERLRDLPVGLPDVFFVFHIELDPAAVALVGDIGGYDLEHNRVADAPADLDRLVIRCRDDAARSLYADALEDRLALVLHQAAAVFLQRPVDDCRNVCRTVALTRCR